MDDDFEALYSACYVRLVRVVTLASGSQADAEEVVQEAFVRLLPRPIRATTFALVLVGLRCGRQVPAVLSQTGVSVRHRGPPS